MLDTSDVIFEDLTTTGTGLYTIAKTQVWHLESKEGWNNESAAIVYTEGDETTHDNATDVITILYRFLCYGGTDDPGDAKAVFLALCDRLNGTRTRAATSGSILTANLITGSPFPDPKKGWPCWQCSFEIVMQA